jgi:hypothetical protein
MRKKQQQQKIDMRFKYHEIEKNTHSKYIQTSVHLSSEKKKKKKKNFASIPVTGPALKIETRSYV